MTELYAAASWSTELLPKMGGNKPYSPSLPARDPYIVGYDEPEDKRFPHDWSLQKKLISCACIGISALTVTMGSALFVEGSITGLCVTTTFTIFTNYYFLGYRNRNA